MATPATAVLPTDSATMAMTVARPSDSVASRLQQLLQSDANFRAVLPSTPVNEAKMRPELGLAQIMALVMDAYADRPALAQRATELVTDPVSGRRTRKSAAAASSPSVIASSGRAPARSRASGMPTPIAHCAPMT